MTHTTTAQEFDLELLTVNQVARKLAVSRSKIYLMMDAGELPYLKLGRTRRVRRVDVDRLIQKNMVGAAV